MDHIASWSCDVVYKNYSTHVIVLLLAGCPPHFPGYTQSHPPPVTNLDEGSRSDSYRVITPTRAGLRRCRCRPYSHTNNNPDPLLWPWPWLLILCDPLSWSTHVYTELELKGQSVIEWELINRQTDRRTDISQYLTATGLTDWQG